METTFRHGCTSVQYQYQICEVEYTSPNVIHIVVASTPVCFTINVITFFYSHLYHHMRWLTISVLQGYCAMITAYSIPSDFVRKSTVSLQIKISTAQLNFSNRNLIIFWK